MEMNATERSVRRVRHELKRRLLEVRQVERVTPNYVRVTLGGDDLAGCSSLAYDDHSKLFFPAAGVAAPVFPGEGEAIMRDYTPRRYDAERGELVFEFALHEGGPASDWAAQAKPGMFLGVGGPRGSFVVEGNFDWYLLIGDESGLPAIARRLEELPKTAKAVVVVEVANGAEQQELTAPDDTKITSCPRLRKRATSAARSSSHARLSRPFAPSTNSVEPTLMTTRLASVKRRAASLRSATVMAAAILPFT